MVREPNVTPLAVPETADTAVHRYPVVVHWEDTDAAGIVYYANYLRFIERARSDLVSAAGIDQRQLWEEDGIMFPVRRAEVDYLRPAHLGDKLEVETKISTVKRASLELQQQITRDAELLVAANIRLACVGTGGRVRRLPSHIHEVLSQRRAAMGLNET